MSIELRLRMSYIPEEHQPSTYRVTRHITLSPDADGGPFKYGVSLYSYMTDYGTVLDLEIALAHVADVGATGVEILGEGHIAGYPEPTTEWIDRWFARSTGTASNRPTTGRGSTRACTRAGRTPEALGRRGRRDAAARPAAREAARVPACA